MLFYPITLSKLAFFTPAWLLLITLLVKISETRATVVLSLFLPMLLGVILIAIFKKTALPYLELVNFRMIATPSNAMDIYNDFFSRHDLTYFCQIRFLKPLVDCPYQEQLSIVMARAYELGNFNASLFSTEGIASVGPIVRAGFGIRVRPRDCPRQSPVLGTSVAAHPDFQRGAPSDFSQRTAHHHVAVAWRSDTFHALVHHAALVVPEGSTPEASSRTDHRGMPAPA